MADNDSAAAAGPSSGPNSAAAAAPAAAIEAAGSDAGTPTSSIESTPEQDTGPDRAQEPAVQPQKRKGGRKPIYATSEERKQRNRQAQAAFRERRTEYIKQLEATIKQNEDSLATLQQSHRTAADECLMLRYKNSLLERILLEKGIDVQAELQMKAGSPVLGSGFMHQQPPLQRTAVQRQQARRSGSSQSFLPKLASGPSNTADVNNFTLMSPHTHPTPSSHASSPSHLPTQSPMVMQQGGMTPPTSAGVAQPQAQSFFNYSRVSQQPQQPGQATFQSPHQQPSNTQRPAQRPGTSSSKYQIHPGNLSNISGVGSVTAMDQSDTGNSANDGAPAAASSFYPSPFQKHFDQLDQEYETHHSRSMLDDPESDDLVTHRSPPIHATYSSQFESGQAQRPDGFYQHSEGMTQTHHHHPHMTSQSQYEQAQMVAGTSGGADGNFDVDHSALDADPFGLSASMHYPTNYTFDQR